MVVMMMMMMMMPIVVAVDAIAYGFVSQCESHKSCHSQDMGNPHLEGGFLALVGAVWRVTQLVSYSEWSQDGLGLDET